MKAIIVGLALAGVSANAATYTMTDGSSFSGGTWDATPPTGGAADAALVLSLANGWNVANDLGSGGWFALNSISLANDVGGTLNGDGLAFAGGNPSAAFSGATTVNTPIRLDADTLFSGSREVHLYGDISGNGKLTVDWAQQWGSHDMALHFHGKRTGTGDTFVKYGILHIYDKDGLGSGTVHVDDPANATYKRMYLHFSGTVPNDFSLCPETSAHANQESLHIWENSGELTFTGKITVNKSKIFIGGNNKIRFDGDIVPANSDAYFVLCVNTGSDAYLTKALNLQKYVVVSYPGRLHLCKTGNVFSELWFYENGWVVCDEDYAFPDGRNFGALANTTGHIDLNGHSQIVGNARAWDSAGGAPVYFYNTSSSAVPTLTMRVTEEHKNAHLRFYGPMNVVKEGGQLLMIMENTFVDGDLTVTEGALKFMVPAAAGTKLAKTITITGGALDLGGGTWRCDRLVMTGGCIQNGVLECDSSDIGPNATCHAELTGSVARRASGNVRQMLPTVEMYHYVYTLPAGTVVYYPFDGSDTEMMKDFGGGGHDLAVGAGTPAYSADGRSGGCLYVDGNSWLTLAGSYPQLMPRGAEPYTVVAWVKRADGCHNSGGWVSYGANYNGGSNSFRYRVLSNIFNTHNYWINNDLSGQMPEIGNGSWHQVVGTWDGSVRRLYCDGSFVISDTPVAPDIGTGTFQIGKTILDANLKGWIDDVLILRRAMTDAEIAENFANGGVPSRKVDDAAQITVAEGHVELDVRRQAVYYPFDSASTLFDDASGSNAGLRFEDPNNTGATCDTADTPGGSANGGSLRLDGNAVLVASNGFPASMPTGNAPYTVCAFVKLDVGSSNGGGWFSYGKKDNNCGNSYHAYNNMAWMENYWNQADMRDTLPNGARFDDGWHSVVCVFTGGPGGRRIHYFDGALWVPYEWMWYPTIGNDLFYVGKTMWSTVMKGHVDELAVYNYALSPEEVASYHNNVRAPDPVVSYPANLDVKVLTDATVSIPSGVALHNLHGQGTVDGDATLASGAELAADDGAVTLTGKLTIAGTGTVTLPTDCAASCRWTLFSAQTIDGAANLADWTVANVPAGSRGSIETVGGDVRVKVVTPGLVIFVY